MCDSNTLKRRITFISVCFCSPCSQFPGGYPPTELGVVLASKSQVYTFQYHVWKVFQPLKSELVVQSLIRYDYYLSQRRLFSLKPFDKRHRKVSREVLLPNQALNFSLKLGTGISAVTEAALISWFQGYQYPWFEFLTGSHQINERGTHQGLSFGVLTLDWNRGSTSSRISELASVPPRLTVLGNTSKPGPVYQPVRKSPEGRVSLPKVEMKEHLGKKPRWTSKFEFDSSESEPEPRSKGSREAFRRWNDSARSETPIPYLKDRYRAWNSRRSYHEHPYWSTNLKYVR